MEEMTGEALVLLLAAVLAGILIWYVVDSILLQTLLKRVGHRYSYAAWVPLWRDAVLFEVGAIRNAWVWAVVLYAVNVAGNQADASSIEGVGLALTLLYLGLYALLMAFSALGVQAGARVSKGAANGWGAALNVVAPWIWRIWMIVRLGKRGRACGAQSSEAFDQKAAVEQGLTFPFARTMRTDEELEDAWVKLYGVYKQPQLAGSAAEKAGSAPQVSDSFGPPVNPYLSAPAGGSVTGDAVEPEGAPRAADDEQSRDGRDREDAGAAGHEGRPVDGVDGEGPDQKPDGEQR